MFFLVFATWRDAEPLDCTGSVGDNVDRCIHRVEYMKTVRADCPALAYGHEGRKVVGEVRIRVGSTVQAELLSVEPEVASVRECLSGALRVFDEATFSTDPEFEVTLRYNIGPPRTSHGEQWVWIQGDARSVQVHHAHGTTLLPWFLGPGEHALEADFGAGHVPAGRVVVTDQPVVLRCSSKHQRCELVEP